MFTIFSLLFSSKTLLAQGTTLFDGISGYNHAATSTLTNQVNPGRQLLFSRITITTPTVITGSSQLSASPLATATTFGYSIRNDLAPHTLVESGIATLTNKSIYTNVTQGGNNTNLDEFSFNSSQLPPGSYLIGVHSTDGNAYQSVAHNAIDIAPLLVENGGTPFFAGANFHLYVRYFGNAVSTANGIPSLPLWGFAMLSLLFIAIVRLRHRPLI